MPQDRNPALATTQNTLPMVLLRAREALMERLRPVLLAHDITEQQWRVIRVLREEGPSDLTTVAEHACILPPSLTRILKNLEGRGIVAMGRDERDGRRRLVSLTPKGDTLISTVTPQVSDVNTDIERALGQDTIAELLRDLDGLLRKLK